MLVGHEVIDRLTEVEGKKGLCKWVIEFVGLRSFEVS